MTDVQWHDLVGNFGIIGALLLALIAFVLYRGVKGRVKPETAVDHYERLRDQIDGVEKAIGEMAEKNRHAFRGDLTAVQLTILNELGELASEMRVTLGRIERER